MPTKKTSEGKTEESEHPSSNLYETSHRILLAAIGAAAVAQEEIDGFIGRMAERGEIAEKDAQKLMKEMWERREKIMNEKRAGFHHRHSPVATRSDIDALTEKVAELNRKLEELKKDMGK
jgi:polyhydroxyalkanoate synthesis regulator phasin